MRRVYKNLCPATISASIMAENMWKNSLKNVESDNKVLYETLLDFFLQQNSTYFLNKPRIFQCLLVFCLSAFSVILCVSCYFGGLQFHWHYCNIYFFPLFFLNGKAIGS